jgi:hypothetical protein
LTNSEGKKATISSGTSEVLCRRSEHILTSGWIASIWIRDAPDTDLAGYPANLKAGYPVRPDTGYPAGYFAGYPVQHKVY